MGWDTVLCDLHDLGYDVRWTLLRAADVGAAHNRARLFAVAADRAVHRWAAPSGWPIARIADGTLNAPHDGLFGAHPLPLAENGHVPMRPAGLMIGGVVWEQDALLGTAQYELLPTPSVADTMGGHERRGGDRSEELLLPGVAAAYARGDLLPTPEASDGTGGRVSAVRGGFRPSGAKRSVSLATALAHDLLPTPRSLDATGVRGQTTNRSAEANAKAGLSLIDVAEHLLPTPTVNDMEKAYTPEEWDVWCDKQRAAHGNGNGHGPSLEIEAARMGISNRWGRYAVAVARCEFLTRPAPDPTLPSGKGDAHRLSPLFVEFLMMLPAGWVTDPALWTHLSASAARNVQLKLLGNGCVTAQAAAAWRHLTSGLVARTQVTALGA